MLCLQGQFSIWHGMTKVKNSAFTFQISYNKSIPLELVVFYEGDDFHEIMQDEYTCLEKATKAAEMGNSFPLDSYIKKDKKHSREGWVTSEQSLGFIGSRPRWYYFFLMNCGSAIKCLDPRGWCQGPVHAEYRLLLTNGVGYMKHFSADEVGILPTAVTFCIVYTLLLIFVLLCVARPLIHKRKFHLTVKYYIISLFLWWVSMWFDIADLAEEGYVGQRLPNAQLTGLVMRAFSESLMLLTVILLAKGWTVVRRKISASGRIKIGIYMTLYIVSSLFTIAAWASMNSEGMFRTPTERNVEYGWFNFFIRLYAFFWFSYSCYTTLKLDTFKKRRCFYMALYGMYSAWILSGPLVVLITLAMATYYRARWTYALDMLCTFVAHTYFAVLFIPSRSNEMFPFAFRTAAMEAQERWNAEHEANRRRSSSQVTEKTSTLNINGPSVGRRMRPRDSELVDTSYGLSNVSGAGGESKNENTNANQVLRQRLKGRQTISGGLQLDRPASRLKNLATSLRKKLGVVYQVADQLEEELELLDVDGEDERGADMRSER